MQNIFIFILNNLWAINQYGLKIKQYADSDQSTIYGLNTRMLIYESECYTKEHGPLPPWGPGLKIGQTSMYSIVYNVT